MISRAAKRLCVIIKDREPQGLVLEGMDAELD